MLISSRMKKRNLSKNYKVLLAVLIIIVILSSIYYYKSEHSYKINITQDYISYNFDIGLKIKDNKENINSEWYSSYFLSDNCSAIFVINSNNSYSYFKIISVDECFETIKKELNSVGQTGNTLFFDYGFIKFGDSKIHFEYDDNEIQISLDYFNINKNFATSRVEHGVYFKEYYVLSPKSKVRGYVKIKNDIHLIEGAGYVDHIWGFWPERKWMWGWIPDVNNKSLIFAYSEKSNVAGNGIILSDQDKAVMKSGIEIEQEGDIAKIISKDFNIELSYDISNKKILKGFNSFKVNYTVKSKEGTSNTEGIIEYMDMDN